MNLKLQDDAYILGKGTMTVTGAVGAGTGA